MRTYSNPQIQQAIEGMRANIIKADAIIESMRKTVELGKRRDDKVTPLTPAQQARIEANKGKHIYGTSHPLYTVQS